MGKSQKNILNADNPVPNERDKNIKTTSSEQIGDFHIKLDVCQKYMGWQAEIVHVPEGVIRLNARLFRQHTEIKQIFLPQSLKKIGKCAFEGCTALEAIHFNDGLLEIGEEAFADCQNLKSVVLPESVKRLGKSAFADCIQLQHVVLPKSLKVVQSRVFEGCSQLKTIIWPENPKIEPLIFARCFEMAIAWEYYQVKDGVCRRILGDMFELCPNGELMTDIYTLRQTYFKTLTLISVSAELDNERLKCRHEIFQTFMSVTHILTHGDPCAMFWAARACVQYVWQHAMQWTVIETNMKLNLVRQILTDIGGCGSRIQVRDMMLYEECVRNIHDPQEAFDLYLHNMRQLLVENADFRSSSLRYHPHHWLNVCWLERQEEQDYWAFATRMDGLFQSIEGARHMHYHLPEPEGGYEAWLEAWSKALYAHEFGILELRFESEYPLFMPRLFFAIEQECVFHSLHDYLASAGMPEILHFWYNGKDMAENTRNSLQIL